MWQGGPSAGFGRRERDGEVNRDSATNPLLMLVDPLAAPFLAFPLEGSAIALRVDLVATM
jgi:hypothetical protein